MNYRMTVYILGLLLAFEGAFMAVPMLTAAVYREPELVIFALVAAACLFIGGILTLFKPKDTTLGARDGFVIVALSWLLLSMFGALPLWISHAIPHYIDALFEIVSGFTTTGASILYDLDALPKCMIMWRSFTHWIGGMGVLVFIMAVLPLAGGTNMYLMKAESPGPSVSKLVPRVRKTALWLYVIYIAMTVLEFILLVIFGMPVFDAINLSAATAGTGGFGISNAGMMIYSPVCIWIITVFMILFAVNFTCYFLLVTGRFKEVINSEVKVFLSIVVIAVTVIVFNVRSLFGSTGEAVMHVSFTVGSLISSTGFSTADFNLWPTLSKTILVMLMFVGACAGSTGGGIKVQRFIILFKNMHNELRLMTHPRQVQKLRIDGQAVEPSVINNVNAYLVCYVLIYMVSLLFLACDHDDLTTNFTAVVATLNNIGPGLGDVGPTSNFDVYSTLSKSVLIFDMLAGRLELFPIILMLSPSTWRK